jgi:hypothetical protein
MFSDSKPFRVLGVGKALGYFPSREFILNAKEEDM